jgi:DnaJ-related protein SCJ1
MGNKAAAITTWIVVLSILLFTVLVEAGKDYYSVLDLDRGASKTQIKKHFKKLSRVYHPDKNPGDSSASARFMEIAEGN